MSGRKTVLAEQTKGAEESEGKKHIPICHIKVKQTLGISVSNFCRCLSKEIMVKNFIIYKKMYLHMHSKEKLHLFYINVYISMTPPTSLAWVCTKWMICWHSYEKKINGEVHWQGEKLVSFKIYDLYLVLDYSTQMS